GRWALLYYGGDGAWLLNDACGLRTVFYHPYASGRVAAGSQPELLRNVFELENWHDPDFEALRAAPEYALLEGASFGPETPYAGCWQLPANHALDLRNGKTRRFFPDAPLLERNPAD